ncbi:MFS transporter [Flagellimonas zhangzhouensis]|uniref:Glycoside/pentoside/hexuronide:cation symporter, GPH family n=1 Tax=Flagellimonas zhangzhouensis TaxID=1073328 RepID=A0A1H2QDB4_9FLAO|nr:MFS transporter [Allomuricauda zhangzhouensis]SDQ51019.1 glycoside/pentoside/hexuronide:cation symporter, GPH family [Allomuricauda zhangzhouensis]SDW04399.1 glycoside/pentoside/hexuronide:cation symporter, GPH family [Allomuricauda zhangzhouensis]
MKTENQKLSILEKVGYGSGDAAVNVVISSMFLIITFFYTDVFGLKPTDMALLFLLVRFIDAITDPLMGIITDRVKTKWGRYRPYFLFLSVPFGISVFLTFTTPGFDYAGKLVYAYITYIFVTIMFTSVTIPYISLISVLTSDPQERLSANGYRLFFAKIAAFMVSIVVPILADKLGGGSISRGYQLAMGIMALVGTGLLLFSFFTTKERVEHVVDEKPLLQQFKLLLKNGQWTLLLGVCFFGTVGYVIRNSVAIFYAKYFLGGDAGMQSTFLATGVVAAILAMPASTLITKKYCKVKLFKWTQIAVGVISLIMLLVVKPGDVMVAYVLYFILSFVVDLHAPIFWSAIAEAVDYGHAESGQRVSGLSFGGISLAQKMGMGIAGAAVGYLLDYFEYVPNAVEQSEFALYGIALMLTVIPGVFHTIMGAMMFRYKITDEYYETIKAKLGI